MIATDRSLRKTDLDEKYHCNPGLSILGCICRSLGFKQGDFRILTGVGIRDHVMNMRIRTPSYLMKRFRPLCSLMAKTAQYYVDDDIPHDFPDWPGCWITARAILIGAAKSSGEAIEIYHDMKEVFPSDWQTNPLRSQLLRCFHQPLLHQGLPLIDHPTIEGAVCTIIGLTRDNLDHRRSICKNDAHALIQGHQEWEKDEIENVFLPLLKDTSQWLQKVIPEGEADDSHREAIRNLTASQTAMIWQLWPWLRQPIQEESPWIYVLHDENIQNQDGRVEIQN